MTVEVGKVAIRAIPDTKNFRRNLENALRKQLQSLPAMQVKANIERVNLNRQKVRKHLQDQFERLRGLRVDVDVNANVKKLQGQLEKLEASDVRFEVIPSFDRMAILRVNKEIQSMIQDIEVNVDLEWPGSDDIRRTVNALEQELRELNQMTLFPELKDSELEWLHHQMRKVKDELQQVHHQAQRVDQALDDVAEDREARIDANPFTAWAAARLAWLTRTRIVEIIPQVSRVALAKAMTSLAALSGARLSFQYAKDFAEWIGDIDKKLPRLAFAATGVATAFSALMGSISGIVGIGDGLAALSPSLLLLPGLFAGAAMSAVGLFVALKYSKEELAELGPSFTNLGEIIRRSFWEDARPAIIDFVNDIMPQLERSFEKTSRAMGRFTAKLAGSFKREFGGGRLEAMFDGLAEAWDELAAGTDAFAGAITNLGLVAAQYMPRLARWFVRQADTFDNWLSKVSTDGRLTQMIEEAIDAYYALWDVAAATTGILQGLWKAAEAGGSSGLRGFADMLLKWEKAIQGARWQETLTAMFRGAGKALDAFGDGLDQVGKMLHTQRSAIEHFMATAGDALGGLIGDIADALSRPAVAKGLTDFIDGVARGFENLKPALGPVSDLIGEIAGFAGELADGLGKVLGTIGKEVVPGIERAIEKIRPKIESLTDAFANMFEDVDWESIGDQLGEILANALGLAEELVPLLGKVISAIDKIGVLDGIAARVSELEDMAKTLRDITDLLSGDELSDDAFSNGGDQATSWASMVAAALGPAGLAIQQVNDRLKESPEAVKALDDAWASVPEIFDDVKLGFETLKTGIEETFADAPTLLTEKAAQIMIGFKLGLEAQFPGVTTFFANLGPQIQSFVADPGSWLKEKGRLVIEGLLRGLEEKFPGISSVIGRIAGTVKSFIGNPIGWLYESGRSVLQGFINGIMDKVEAAKRAISRALSEIRDFFPFSPAKEGPFAGRGWVAYSGQSVGTAFGESAAESLRAQRAKFAASLSVLQGEFGGISAVAGSGAPGGGPSHVEVSLAGAVLQAELEGQPITLLVKQQLAGAFSSGSAGALNSKLGARRS